MAPHYKVITEVTNISIVLVCIGMLLIECLLRTTTINSMKLRWCSMGTLHVTIMVPGAIPEARAISKDLYVCVKSIYNRRFPRSMRSQGERPGCGSHVKRVDTEMLSTHSRDVALRNVDGSLFHVQI